MMSNIDLLTGLPGFRDYYPELWREINFVISKMRNVAQKYGYEEYEGPSVESLALIEAKSGADLMKEIFQLSDRSNRKLLLRPEQTPTLARMLAKDHQRYKRPIRWFSIPRLFRDETVQKGRVREFWQLNVDILGEDSLTADAETIAVAVDIFRACGLKDSQFRMVINHRELLNSFISSISDIDPLKIIPVIDKKMAYMQTYAKNYLEDAGYEPKNAIDGALLYRRLLTSTGEYRDSLISNCQEEIIELINKADNIEEKVVIQEFKASGLDGEQSKALFNLTSISGTPSEFIQLVQQLELPKECHGALDDLIHLTDYLIAYDVIQPIIYDASLARGLDYYTGIVYEAFDVTGEIVRALCGGGRYDDLVADLGGSPLAGTGFGMGETVLLEMLRQQDVLPPKLHKIPELYLAPIKKEVFPDIIKLANRLKQSFEIICNPFDWRVKRHLESADNTGISLVLLLGPKDIEKGVVSVRKIETGEQLELQMDGDLEKRLREIIN